MQKLRRKIEAVGDVLKNKALKKMNIYTDLFSK